MFRNIVVFFCSVLTLSSVSSGQVPLSILTMNQSIECLALNIYHEMRASSKVESMAVSDVVMNRVRDDRFPDTVCGVVKQAKTYASGKPKPNQCQFSWYCDKLPDEPKNMKAWAQSVAYAHEFLIDHRFQGVTDGSTHYHAYYVNPGWSKTKTPVARIGSHLFYRWEKNEK